MTLGLVGKKVGMTRIFTDTGTTVPVTVLSVDANRVTQLKDKGHDGYGAVQVTAGSRRPNRVTKPMAGHFKKAGVEPGLGLWEFRFEGGPEEQSLEPGSAIGVGIFEAGQRVDVQGVSIGKGFMGVVKRYGFHGGRGSHGASLTHRAPGSIGQCQDPGRVFPGKKMAGQMGHARRTQQGLEVVRVDLERSLLLIKGSVPGAKGGTVMVRPSAKAPRGR
ncbi:MAG: 50S ribosomal protein L3 [Gammaproteobacteria bacterium]|nr:50S ribosomal protein L3 [Gammaproteobacteria bacterium]